MATRPLTRIVMLALILGSHTTAQADDTWQACHQADVKALRVFTVGEAILSRKNCQASDLLTPPVKLEFAYFREVPGDAFAKAAMHYLEKNLTKDTFTALSPRLEAFNQHYRDVSDGDRYALIWQQQRLELFLNGTLLTHETGDTFARHYLQIWFGNTPYSRSLKQDLLGAR
ncbi:MAG: hypothetical protein CL537_06730 [Alcanivoracaceae bacterium]|nr:hypothetical protein [Alcanivoracaceae bacterium]MED5432194.1 chalcone isomerase family protein [Pseudomonadota bacterium]MEE2871173.1 chalcone isomerase family protein [Pseudomonadota bacterium]